MNGQTAKQLNSQAASVESQAPQRLHRELLANENENKHRQLSSPSESEC